VKHSILQLGILFSALTGSVETTHAQQPQDSVTGYSSGNTAMGINALFSLFGEAARALRSVMACHALGNDRQAHGGIRMARTYRI
jgi:hypothetical protein